MLWQPLSADTRWVLVLALCSWLTSCSIGVEVTCNLLYLCCVILSYFQQFHSIMDTYYYHISKWSGIIICFPMLLLLTEDQFLQLFLFFWSKVWLGNMQSVIHRITQPQQLKHRSESLSMMGEDDERWEMELCDSSWRSSQKYPALAWWPNSQGDG